MILYSISEWLDLKLCLLSIVLVIILADLLMNRIPSNFPPGPSGLPLVGSLFTNLDFDGRNKLAKEYGDVYSLRFGSERQIFAHGYKLVREALVTKLDSFADRPSVPVIAPFFQGIGVIMSNGPMWKVQRKFTYFHIRHFGDGQKKLEQVTQRESALLCDAFRDQTGPFDPADLLHYAVGNTVMSLALGHRFEYNDEQFHKMLTYDFEALLLSEAPMSLMYNVCPWIFKHLPGPHQTVFRNYVEIESFFKKEIKNHIDTWDPANPRDFIDAYLTEINKEGAIEESFNMATLLVCTVDLFEAGIIGPKATMCWLLVYMMKHPEIQAKVQAEIDRVIGPSRQPTLEDRPNMPYTQAVIQETIRLGVVIPFGFPKMATKDTTLGGYFIPKGTVLQTDFSTVLRDKDEWETPDTFNPEHFLDAEGNLRKREAFFPFSLGKRSCLGEQVARMELFLFVTSLLQHFTFAPVPGTEISLEGDLGFAHLPKPYKLRALPR